MSSAPGVACDSRRSARTSCAASRSRAVVPGRGQGPAVEVPAAAQLVAPVTAMPPIPVRVLVLADTHLGPGQASRLAARLGDRLHAADAILHAGDITDSSVLAELSTFAPVYAVLGNNDHGVALPERRVIDLAGCQVAMVHDSGDAAARSNRLRRMFPDADVVVFGHSHLPWNETNVRVADGHVQHHLNPGSAIQQHHAPRCTVAWLQLDDGSRGVDRARTRRLSGDWRGSGSARRRRRRRSRR